MGYFGLTYLQVELILVGLQNGLTTDEIASQLSLEELAVQRMAEIVRLSERSRSHAEAPDLTQEELV